MSSNTSSSTNSSSSWLPPLLSHMPSISSSTEPGRNEASLSSISESTFSNMSVTSFFSTRFRGTLATSSSLSSSVSSVMQNSSLSSNSSSLSSSLSPSSSSSVQSSTTIFTILGMNPLKKLIKQSFQLHEFMRMNGLSKEECSRNLKHNISTGEMFIAFKGKTYGEGKTKVLNFKLFDDLANLAWIKMNLDIDLFQTFFPEESNSPEEPKSQRKCQLLRDAFMNIFPVKPESLNKYQIMLNAFLKKFDVRDELTFSNQYSEKVYSTTAVLNNVILGVGKGSTKEESEIEASKNAVAYIQDCFEKIYAATYEHITVKIHS